MTIEQNKLREVPTQKLEFLLGVGRAGLTMWKGIRLAEVREHLKKIEDELERRKAA